MKKHLLRIVSFILVFFLITTTESISALASQAEGSQNEEYLVGVVSARYQNPVYYSDGTDEPEIYEQSEYVTDSWSAVPYDSADTYITDYDTVVDEIRDALVNRTDYEVNYKMSTTNAVLDTATKMYNSAIVDTGVPDEGDYIQFQLDGYEITASYYVYNSEYYIQYSFDFTYYTTLAQEQKVDTKIAQVIAGFNFTNSTSRYDKVKTIYDYICNNVVYDNANLNNDSYNLKYTAYAALINKTAVCQGYAVLMYRMLREAGVNVKVVAGGNHAWNIIQLGEYYYYGDTTWDAGLTNYYYFLKGKQTFTGHTLESRFTTSQFTSQYPMANDDYDPSGSSTVTGPITGVTLKQTKYIYTGSAVYPEYKVTDAYGQELVEGTEYIATYSNNSAIGTATITIKGTGSYYGEISKTYTIIPDTTTLNSVENTSSGVTVKWSKVAGVTGYYVYRRNTSSDSWSRIATISSASTVTYTDTTAESGTTYYYTVKAYKGTSYGGYNNTGLNIVRLSQPTVSSVANQSYGINVKWSKVTGAAGYYVYRKLGSGSWTKISTISSGSTLEYKDVSAADGVTYSYTVKAYSGSTNSSMNSTGKSLIRLSQPELSSSISDEEVVINWGKITGAEGYYVYRRLSGGSWGKIATVTSADITTYTDNTAVEGNIYNYTVRAYSGSILSSYDEPGVTTQLLVTPKISSIANASGGITIKWNKLSEADSYSVYRKVAGGSYTLIKTITDISTVTFTDSTVTAGTTYTYSVVANYDKFSSNFDETGKTIKRLTQPGLSSVSNASNGITVKWSKVTGASGYYVYRKVSGGNWSKIGTVTSGSTVTYTDKTATADTTYIYTVKAYSGSYVSSYNATGKTLKRLTQPVISSASNASSGVTVKWSKVTGASGYYVYRKVSGGSWSKIGTVTSGSTVTYTDKTAAAGNTYIYTVKAYSGSYVSSYNATGKTVKRLTQPGISSASNISSGVTVKWSKVTGASGYYVYRKLPGGNWSKIGTVTSGSTVTYTDKTAAAGKTYVYTIRAYSGSILSSYNATGKTIKRLTQPSFSLKNVSGGIKVSWSSVAGTSNYYVYRKTSGGSWKRIGTVKAGTLSFTDKTAVKGKTYIYTVRAISGSYSSSYHSGKSIKKS